MRATAWPLLLAASLTAAPPYLGPGHALEPRATFTDALGQTHTRLAHRYQGLRVWGSEYITHSAPGQRPLPGTHALAAAPPLEAPRAALSPDQARQGLRAVLGAGVNFPGPAEAILYPLYLDRPQAVKPGVPVNATQIQHYLTGYAQAYLVRVDPGTPNTSADDWDCIVAADTGAILAQFPVGAKDRPSRGVGQTLFSGAVALDTTRADAGFLLVDRTRGAGGAFGGNAVTDGSLGSSSTRGTVVFSATDFWGDGHPEAPGAAFLSANAITVAADAAFGLQSAWDYFAQAHHRNGIDGQGTATYLKVHTTAFEDNASWVEGEFHMEVGGPGRFLQPVTPEILGHELTHGVTETTAGLGISGETGGLNEATSDIFGALVGAFARNGGALTGPATPHWTVDHFPNVPGGQFQPQAARNMIKPSLDGVSRDAWEPDLRLLDEHDAAGPMNRAFYLLSQGAAKAPAELSHSPFLPEGMAGIGNDKAAAIWYRALTTYLTPASRYVDARLAALRAATDLYGPGSPENLAVRQAFAAINVGDAVTGEEAVPPPPVTASATWSGAQLTLTAAVATPGVAQVDFLVDQVPVASLTEAPFTVTLDASRLLANGPHTLVATAFSPEAGSGISAPVPFTQVTATQQLLRNPGFEGVMSTSWLGDFDRTLVSEPTGQFAHGGIRAVALNRRDGAQRKVLAQRVAIPAGSAYATLTLWAKVDTDAVLAAEDFLRVQVLSVPPAGGEPALLASFDAFSNLDFWGDWADRAFDLTPFAGQTVELRLVSEIQANTATEFVLDDVTLVVGPSAPVAVQVTPGRVMGFDGLPIALVATVTGAADGAVLWRFGRGPQDGALSPGAQPGTVMFTPPGPRAEPDTVRIRATSVADPGAWAEASVLLLPPVTVVPMQAVVAPGATLGLEVLLAPSVAGFTVTQPEGAGAGGTVTIQGRRLLFVAGATPGAFLLEVRDAAHPEVVARATIVVRAPTPVAVLPTALELAAGASAQFAASVPGATWSVAEGAGGGHLTPSGLYTAPGAPGTYHVVATGPAGPSQSGTATVTVVAGPAINPMAATLLTGATLVFTASLPPTLAPGVTWSVLEQGGGTITTDGAFTAPGAPGTCTVVATSVADPTQFARATVTVRSTDLNGDGVTLMDPADLALLADAWGSAEPLADLNGDGVVDDADVQLFFSRFGGLP